MTLLMISLSYFAIDVDLHGCGHHQIIAFGFDSFFRFVGFMLSINNINWPYLSLYFNMPLKIIYRSDFTLCIVKKEDLLYSGIIKQS
jgi:hypothetical protein